VVPVSEIYTKFSGCTLFEENSSFEVIYNIQGSGISFESFS